MTLRRNIVLGALKEALKSLLILLWEEGHILSPLSLSLAFQVRIHANLGVMAMDQITFPHGFCSSLCFCHKYLLSA